jgi:hypothetical protein
MQLVGLFSVLDDQRPSSFFLFCNASVADCQVTTLSLVLPESVSRHPLINMPRNSSFPHHPFNISLSSFRGVIVRDGIIIHFCSGILQT